MIVCAPFVGDNMAVRKKVVFTYNYVNERGNVIPGCNETHTKAEAVEIVQLIGAKKYNIIKRTITIKDEIVK